MIHIFGILGNLITYTCIQKNKQIFLNKTFSVFVALVITCQASFFDSSFSDSLSSAELSSQISQEDESILLSAELPSACKKIPQAFTRYTESKACKYLISCQIK